MAGQDFYLKGVLKGHGDWVTSIAAPLEAGSDILLSASRDKSVMVWRLDNEQSGDGEEASAGVPVKSLTGHSHYIEDVQLSYDGQFALSGSWDGTLRLWDLQKGETARRFVGHKKDVLSVAFSADNRQIVSGSRDKTIKLWNTLAECKYTIKEESHSEWVSTVRFSPNARLPLIVSGGWDKVVKVWNLGNCKLKTNLHGHTGYINTTTVSPDGTLCASGGKDGVAMLWDLEEGKFLYSLDAGDCITSLIFSPKYFWLCAACEGSIKIWDLETKSEVANISPDFSDLGKKAIKPYCTSLAWSADGQTLFAGFTDNLIRAYGVSSTA